jgi:hypothetical protein
MRRWKAAQTAQTAQVIAAQGQQTGAAIATMADAVLAAAANMGVAVQTMSAPRSITLERGKHGELTGARVVGEEDEGTPYN